MVRLIIGRHQRLRSIREQAANGNQYSLIHSGSKSRRYSRH